MRATAGVDIMTRRQTRRHPRTTGAPAAALARRVEQVMLAHVPHGAGVCVGLSGGVDSVVLLDLLHAIAPKYGWKLSALHVNHQISEQANAWAAFCRRLCRARGVPLRVHKVVVARGDSLEAAAREARYAAYRRQRAPFVVLAQHQDDQAETVLLQLLRGAGVRGLAAMPVLRQDVVKPGLRFLRPLLEVPRGDIVAWATSRALRWVEDDSNEDAYYLRNFLRHDILPRIAARVPEYRATLARAARHFAEASHLLEALAEQDVAGAIVGGTLAVAALAALPAPRARNVLRHFLSSQGARMPDARRLDEALRQALEARIDARVCVDLGDCTLRRHRARLYVVPVGAMPVRGLAMAWRGERRLVVPGLGALDMRRRRGAGIALDKLTAQAVTLRLRHGGERMQPEAGRPRRPVKDLLQIAQVPPWPRAQLPFLWSGDRLVWVAGVGIDQAFRAAANAAGVIPFWHAGVTPGEP
jgi:tRNA(Ile)-lysidine synthase